MPEVESTASTSAPDPVAALLLDAVERTFANDSPSTVSMRAIAAEADCSLGLAYNYFDSKMDLIAVALDRMAERITSEAVSVTDPGEALLVLLDAMGANPAFPRVVTWMVLEGHDVSGVMSGHPLIASVAMIAADGGAEDPESVAMMLGLLAVGTFTYGAMLNRTVGRQPDDRRLLEAAADMYGGWFPRADP